MTEQEFTKIRTLINGLMNITPFKSTMDRCDEALQILDRDKQLLIHVVSSSALIDKAEMMQKENDQLIKDARGHWDKEYKKAIGIGIDRIIKLIKRHYC